MPTDAINRRDQYERTRAALWLEKSSFDAHWGDLANFVKPKRLRAYVTDRNKGDRRNRNIIDSTATLAHRTLQSGMHAGMTSPARPWFKLSTPDPALAKFKPVKQWLHDVTMLMLAQFQKSNVYTALPTLYGDIGLFGTGCGAVMEDEKDVFRCYSYPIGTYAFGVSKRQMVNTFVREYQLTVEQLIEEFGRTETGDLDRSRFSQTVLNLYDRGDYQQIIDVCWIVAPNPDRDDAKIGAKYLPFSSYHFEGAGKGQAILRESGFHEFPILAARWEVQAEDIYGTDCPGMTALGDVRGLQTMAKRKAQAVEKMVNPPLQAPTSVRANGVTILPGGVNYVDQAQPFHGIRPVHEVNMPIGELREDVQDMRELIRRAFYEDLFLMLATTDRRDMTAREVEERHEEKLLALGPVLERTEDEVLEPLIDRTYPMMERRGDIPEPPQELDGVALKIEYTSILSQAQKLVGVVGMDRWLQTTMSMAQIFPQVKHKVNVFPIIDKYADAFDVPPEFVYTDDEAQRGMQQEQQALAAQQQAQTAALMARGARDLGATPVNEDNALRQMVGPAAS